jgi:hypothetical protein
MPRKRRSPSAARSKFRASSIGEILGAARDDQPRVATREAEHARRGARDAREQLQLIHRGFRHRRPEGRQGSVGGVERSALQISGWKDLTLKLLQCEQREETRWFLGKSHECPRIRARVLGGLNPSRSSLNGTAKFTERVRRAQRFRSEGSRRWRRSRSSSWRRRSGYRSGSRNGAGIHAL